MVGSILEPHARPRAININPTLVPVLGTPQPPACWWGVSCRGLEGARERPAQAAAGASCRSPALSVACRSPALLVGAACRGLEDARKRPPALDGRQHPGECQGTRERPPALDGWGSILEPPRPVGGVQAVEAWRVPGRDPPRPRRCCLMETARPGWMVAENFTNFTL